MRAPAPVARPSLLLREACLQRPWWPSPPRCPSPSPPFRDDDARPRRRQPHRFCARQLLLLLLLLLLLQRLLLVRLR